MGDRFGVITRRLVVRRRQLPFRLVDPGPGLGADAVAMPGHVVGDLAQSGVRGGQRPPHRGIAGLDVHLAVARLDPPRGTPVAPRAIEHQHQHDGDREHTRADRDRHPDPL